MSHVPRVAVVATHSRPDELARLLDALAPQCHLIVVVDNASDPPVSLSDPWPVHVPGQSLSLCRVHVIRDEEQPPNLSRLWNVGLDYARKWMFSSAPVEPEPYDVAVLNDDAVPPPGWWDVVSGAMRDLNADAACCDPFGHLPPGATCLYGPDAPMSVTTRLAGWAMMLRGEWDGARFDERLRWWYADDEISLRARQAGGLVHVGFTPVENTGANSSTVGVLAEQAGRDRVTFVEITGRLPW